ncbi:MAG: hypothetical protein CMJ18_18760 [Phycisphaeraceae bacterium]|nr:hypothetical protein [Phycisphaeraceae bacterium]
MDPSSEHGVSVVIPCYNGMPFLPAALDSVITQTYRPAEIIVVDDGSTDESGACVRDYAGRHPDLGIRLIEQANRGESASRNRGITAAGQEWIAQLDADDWWEPDKLASQVAILEADTVLAHTGQLTHRSDGGGADRVEPHDLEQGRRRVGRCTKRLVEPDSISHSSILVRRDALNRIGGYDADLQHAVDIDLYFRLSILGTFAFVPRHLVHYRIHDRQTSWNHRLDQVRGHVEVVQRFFAQHPDAAEEVGRDFIDDQLARLLQTKLESFWWNRTLDAFRRLVAFADEHVSDPAMMRPWRRRARYPDWLVHLKDRVIDGRSGT